MGGKGLVRDALTKEEASGREIWREDSKGHKGEEVTAYEFFS